MADGDAAEVVISKSRMEKSVRLFLVWKGDRKCFNANGSIQNHDQIPDLLACLRFDLIRIWKRGLVWIAE